MRPIITITAFLSCAALLAQQKWTLQQCLQRAEEKNLTVRGAQLNVELADRVHDQAFWSFLPSLNAGGTHGYNWGKTIDRYTNSFANDRVRTNNFWVGSEVSLVTREEESALPRLGVLEVRENGLHPVDGFGGVRDQLGRLRQSARLCIGNPPQNREHRDCEDEQDCVFLYRKRGHTESAQLSSPDSGHQP